MPEPCAGMSRHVGDCSATALAGTQGRCAIGSEGTTQPENLAPAQIRQRRRGLDGDPAVRQVGHDTKPGQFLTAHLDHRHRTSPRTSRRQPASVTSLSGTRVTFLSVAYRFWPHQGVIWKVAATTNTPTTGGGLPCFLTGRGPRDSAAPHRREILLAATPAT